MSGLIILGYLCLLLSFIFALVGMTIDPKTPVNQDPNYTHSDYYYKNLTFSQFGTTLAVMGLAFLYAGKN